MLIGVHIIKKMLIGDSIVQFFDNLCMTFNGFYNNIVSF